MASWFEELRRIAYSAYVEEKNRFWISNTRYNGIYSIDMEAGELCFHGRFSGHSSKEKLLHSYAIEFRGDIFFLPWNGNSIDKFNIREEKTTCYPITCWSEENGHAVIGYYQWDDRLFLVPKNLKNPLIYFSLKTKEYREVNFEGLHRFLDGINTPKEILTLNVINIKERVFFIIYETNYLIELNLAENKETIYEIPSKDGLDTIGYDGTDFWLGQSDNVIQWNLTNGIVNTYKGVLGERTDKKNIVAQFIPYGDYIYIIPLFFGAIGKIDKKTKEIKHLLNLPEGYRRVSDGTEKWRHLRNAFVRDKELIINPVGMNMVLHLNLLDDSIYGEEYLASPIAVGCDWKVYSDEDASLSEFIKYKVAKNENIKKELRNKENIGCVIYKMIGDERIG